MAKEFLRFKQVSTGKYLTWDEYGHDRFRAAVSGQGRSAKDLKQAMTLFEEIATKSPSMKPISDIVLVKQEVSVMETVIGNGINVGQALEQRNLMEAKKKRYEAFKSLQAEFDPSAGEPEMPSDLVEEASKEKASALVDYVADTIFGEDGEGT
jgi:hypothetical protein